MDRQRSLSVARLHGCSATREIRTAQVINSERNSPPAKISNCSTTDLDNVSQFRASNRELIRRSRSSTIRRCCGYEKSQARPSTRKKNTYWGHLLHPSNMLVKNIQYGQRRLRNVSPVSRS
jgi:hypothetical protein